METTVEIEQLGGEGPYRVTVSTPDRSRTVETRSLSADNPDEVIVEAGMTRLIYQRAMVVQKDPDFDGGVHEIVPA